MKEEFIHFLWRYLRFDLSELKTTRGETIQIIETGEYNRDAGPDFTNARIRLGDTLWAGNVEMHLKSSDWLLHRHQEDSAYRNVILHVVFEDDQPIPRDNGEPLPCLELRRRIPAGVYQGYEALLRDMDWIPCEQQLHKVPDTVRYLWLERMLVERLEQKTIVFEQRLHQNQNHWEEVFYEALARNFGVKVNADPFEQLARSAPLALLSKYRNSLFQVEAILFGQAGLLHDHMEGIYPQRLWREYCFMQQKHHLTPMVGSAWKMLRLRPANFPTIRIAEFAALICESGPLFAQILEARTLKEISRLFQVGISGYWDTHYHFGKASNERHKSLGRETIELLTINTIAPFLFLYGRRKGNSDYEDRAFQLLEEVRPEMNQITEGWRRLGVKAASAYQSQALLQLRRQYCEAQKCLDCAIGCYLLK